MKPAGIAPTRGTNASSYEWILDVGIRPLNPADPVDYLTIPDITALQPNASPTTSDGTTYANKGQQDQVTIGEGFNLAVNVKVVTDASGEVIPGLALLIEAANAMLDQDRAADRVISVRWYHYKIPNLAYEFTAEVNWTRANTGNTDNEFLSFTLTSKGDRKSIANPALDPVALPTIVDITPEGVASGGIIRVSGTALAGATSVTVDDVSTPFVQVGGTAVYVTLGAGTAGPVPVVVKTTGGESAPKQYTRG